MILIRGNGQSCRGRHPGRPRWSPTAIYRRPQTSCKKHGIAVRNRPWATGPFREDAVHDAEDFRSIRLTLIVYAIVFAGKLITYMVTGVMAVFAEALHTLSDIFISGFLLAALHWARKKADREHMFGHGRAQN